MKKHLRKTCQGSMVIEAAYIFPLLFMVIYVILTIIFYYHDKNILQGAAYETAVVGRAKCHTEQGMNEEELAAFGEERISGKLILFQSPDVEVLADKKVVTVTASVKKGWKGIQVTGHAKITEPENFMRQCAVDLESGKTK